MSFSLLLPYLSIIYAASRISLNFNPSSPPLIATALAFLVSEVTNQPSCGPASLVYQKWAFNVIPLLRDVLWLARAFTIKSSISEWLSKSLLVLPPIVILPAISWSSWKTTTAAPPSQPSTDIWVLQPSRTSVFMHVAPTAYNSSYATFQGGALHLRARKLNLPSWVFCLDDAGL